MSDSAHGELFTNLRPLLFTIAYEMLGSATEADDVLQESYLRWAQVDLDTVTDTKAYLAQIVSRQALNTLRTNSRRREEYVGPWLPEPVRVTFDDNVGDASTDIVLAESVSMAMLVVLETLAPDERAVFVMREVFGFDYDEIASTVCKSEAAVRQMAHRAREHVQSRRRRFTPTDRQAEEITTKFLLAAAGGDVDTLMEMLAPDAVWTSDGGGKVSAARRPVYGADKVARVAIGLSRASAEFPDVRLEFSTYNSTPALLIYSEGRLDTVLTLAIADGKVAHVFAIRNPEKLATAETTRRVSR
ncbi:RNA polymerase sigma-70 factor [Mycobacterium sp. CBMA271]|uniref:RNA polymerase sigma-70 factor n=1 Tax=unclassified Mycobacteroides TaxID=2618759 RepID=UPI0013277D92|nr:MULTISPECIES: RNA polymerase sigma-70 factor [unclassified Mycobacteroides]MUM15598.1 RNA polymerase subunit sigma-24 [Mycobacteroides sp. CBMA 326]MUM17393.1 RNA polymerase subunit sigma-24 [Mycobacteroides sp. CBMA 326]MUM21868.1 RNA polymerase sigma-70 factor [Mycobacteroides sp. CBMA 271]